MNNEDRKVFFIVNKFSGTGYKANVEGIILDSCRDYDMECTIEFTRSAGHATRLATEAIDAGFTKVVGVGGDGTINEVARALVNSGVTMGIVPKGSGNGLARHLGIPVSIQSALQCLFTSQVITMDTFRINGKLSLNVSGIGFDGYVAEKFGLDRRRGIQGYTRHILNEFNAFREFDATIVAGERQFDVKAFVIAIANSSQYGNNARIAPTASVSDEILDITILKKMPPYRLDFIYSFFTGTVHQSAYCKTLQVKDALIKLPSPISYHIDGEPAGRAQEFDVQLVPASLRLMAPCTLAKY